MKTYHKNPTNFTILFNVNKNYSQCLLWSSSNALEVKSMCSNNIYHNMLLYVVEAWTLLRSDKEARGPVRVGDDLSHLHA